MHPIQGARRGHPGRGLGGEDD
ncbi:hypothetical protein AZE42_06469 [Rhizopogon vesiculosus]|uniref:Uncharacterized protein n=1 Tax=Rhizopogon vesiculosus TaxID=180088 RepID=A0A1J8Q017_9AGAM|nr:hypothetical protein AZE42_06469 [Rhizopogon vesiculosus]